MRTMTPAAQRRAPRTGLAGERPTPAPHPAPAPAPVAQPGARAAVQSELVRARAVAPAGMGGRPAAAAATVEAARARADEPAGAASEHQGDAEHVRLALGQGQPLPDPVRALFERRFRADFSGVRVHPDEPVVAELGAAAVTVGDDIAFAPGQRHDDPAGNRLLAHELAHVLQQRAGATAMQAGDGEAGDGGAGAYEAEADRAAAAVLEGGDPGTLTPVAGPLVQRQPPPAGADLICEPNTSSFVLDPALSMAPAPPDVTTHVLIRPPGPAPHDLQYVKITAPVHQAQRFVLYAVRASDAYATEAEAQVGACDPLRVPSDLQPWSTAYTASGEFTVTAVDGAYVLTRDHVDEAIAAAAVVLLDTDAGWYLVDAGIQLSGSDEEAGAALGRELAWQVGLNLRQPILDEVILSPSAPDGHVLPQLAQSLVIRRIRATAEQYAMPSVIEALRDVADAAPETRRTLADRLRASLDADRAEWEASQPIAPNESYREQQWTAWREAQVQAVLDGLGPPVHALMATGDEGSLEPVDGPQPAQPGAILDLTSVEWEPADDLTLYIQGDVDKLGVTSSVGFLLRPAPPPTATVVPGLRAPGPRGVTPPSARPAQPLLGVPAIGKEMLVLARTNRGMGVVFDAGGASMFAPLDALARLQAGMGISRVEHLAVTHPHGDHVRNITELITRFQIPAGNLVMSDAWLTGTSGQLAEIVRDLRATTDPVLRDTLGYGPDWTPGRPTARTGVVQGQVALGGGQTLDYVGMGEAQARYADAHRAAGARAPAARLGDTASFLYFLGNANTPHRVAILGDMRGTDIVDLHATMEAAAPGTFRAAFENVRVVVGFGHHFGPDAGTTPKDIQGMELLLRETLLRNGELTIVVQSERARAMTESGGGTSRLLEFVTGMGARVVMAGRPGEGLTGEVELNTRLEVTARGDAVEVVPGANEPVQALRRLMELREARRLVQTEPELAPRLLRLEGQTAQAIEAELNTQIQRLEGLLNELLGRRATELLEARRGAAVTDVAVSRFRAARPSRPVADIHRGLMQVQGIESQLVPEVRTHLRAAALYGSSFAVEAGISPMPRGVADALTRVPPELAQRIRDHYAEMERMVANIEGDTVPAEQRVELLARAEALRTELTTAVEALPEAERAPFQPEIERLDQVVERLKGDVVSDRRYARTASGHLVTTEYRLARARAGVEAGMGAMGTLLGGLMVVHSIEGLSDALNDAGTGQADVPEAALRAAHAAYGLNLGVRMITMSRVSGGKFVVLALLDIGSTMAADYASTEERDIAITRSVIHNSVNLICMAVGSKIVAAGLASTHPVSVIGLSVLGTAIMFAGEPLLRLIGLDGLLVDWLSFPPRQVTHVHRKIEELLDEYETLIGMRSLATRDAAELRSLGAPQPEHLRVVAMDELHRRARRSRELESEIMDKFEDAYERARTAYFGLRELDALAHRFSRLRYLAKSTREHGPDRGHAEIQERFSRIDRGLDLSDASEDTIRGMEQWTTLDEKFDEVHGEIYKGPDEIDYDKLMESYRELEWMMESARYRLDPRPQGSYRVAPLLRPGTRAREVYEEELHRREHRMARYVERLADIGTGDFSGMPETARSYISAEIMDQRLLRYDTVEQERRLRVIHERAEQLIDGMPAIDANHVLQRLLRNRAIYDRLVAEARRAMPEMAQPETWSDPVLYERRARAALAANATVIRRVQLAEMALQAAVAQARSQVATGEAAGHRLVGNIRIEIEGAEDAMRRRRHVDGIPLPGEVDETIRQRRLGAQGGLATALGARPDAPMLSDEEVAALRTDAMEAAGGGRVFSPQAQLARLLEAEREAGVAAHGAPTIYRVVGDFDVTDLFIFAIVHRSVSASENVLVGDTGDHATGLVGGRGHYTGIRVLPLNQAAVDLFGGTGPRRLPNYILQPVDPAELGLPTPR